MGRPYKFTFPAEDEDGICAAQQLGSAGALTINGVLLDAVTFNAFGIRQVLLPGIQRTVSISSTGNLSGVDFTITGKDVLGRAATATIAGPNNTTVETTAEFSVIESVTANGAVGTDVTVGTGTVGRTNWFMSNLNVAPANLTVAIAIAGTASVTVQDTPDDVLEVETPTLFDHVTLDNLTQSTESNYAFPPRFVRGVMNSSDAGSFEMTIIQAGI